MGSSSESDGEIIEMREDMKAISAPNSFVKDRQIDRRSYSSSYPAPASPPTESRNGTRSRHDRSPSPYRHSRDDHKRKRSEPYPSSRDLYEHPHKTSRPQRTYQDLDDPADYASSNGFDYNNAKSSQSHDRDRRHDRYHASSTHDRDRSRSPWRPGKETSQDGERHHRGREESARNHRGDAKNRELRKQPAPNFVTSQDSSARDFKRVKFEESVTAGNKPATYANKHRLSSSSGRARAEEPEVIEPVDEEAEIERRRRERQATREALLNKSKPSALLAQALHVSTTLDSVPTTPQIETPSRESRQVTPTISNPSTPRQESVPNSPGVGDDLARELARLGEGDVDEPSAAMYDPNMDVDEDRAKHEAERGHHGELSAGAYDETKELEHKEALIPEADDQITRIEKGSDDMFADGSDDDDDMFAEKPMKALNAAHKAVAVPEKGRALAADLHDSWDTPDGFYKTIVGELIDNRYVVKAALGKGVFATVIRAQDSLTHELVAIKIVRNNEAMRKAGATEIEILTTLGQADAEDQFHIVRLQRYFTHKNHLCMVFENLGYNLRDVVKSYGRKTGLELQVVRSYAVQMFKALALLRKCEILHADLKPDNILNDAGAGKKIKIADLGSATPASDNEVTPYLASRFYRAPEVMLGIPPSYPIDMWAIGCTLFELYTDAILFAGKSNNDMLRAIQECRGKISKKVVRRGEDQIKYAHFDANLDLFASVERVGIPPKDTVRWITFGSQPLPGKDIKTRLLRAASKKGTTRSDHLKELDDFRDLLDKCLKLDPEERLSPRQALTHKFCSAKPPTSTKIGGKH